MHPYLASPRFRELSDVGISYLRYQGDADDDSTACQLVQLSRLAMDTFQQNPESSASSIPQIVNMAPQIARVNEHNLSSPALDFSLDQYGDEINEGFEDRDDAKRRRIAKV